MGSIYFRGLASQIRSDLSLLTKDLYSYCIHANYDLTVNTLVKNIGLVCFDSDIIQRPIRVEGRTFAVGKTQKLIITCLTKNPKP